MGCTSRSMEARKAEHRRCALVENRNTKFYRALRTQGFDNFKWHIAYYCTSVSEMFAKEIYAIQKHGTYTRGFNSTKGGDGTIRGKGTRSALQIVRQTRQSSKRKFK